MKELAQTMAELEARKDVLRPGGEEAMEQLHVLFDEMMQMCLWFVLSSSNLTLSRLFSFLSRLSP